MHEYSLNGMGSVCAPACREKGPLVPFYTTYLFSNSIVSTFYSHTTATFPLSSPPPCTHWQVWRSRSMMFLRLSATPPKSAGFT
jgi:hypothetical protein